MSELSPKAQALVQSGRAALRPSTEDRARVLTGLRSRLGVAVSTPTPRSSWLAASAAVVVAGVAAAIGLRSPEPVTPPPAAKAVVPSTMVAAPAAPNVAPAPETPPTLAPEATSPPGSAPSVRRAPGKLAEEVAVLSQAAKALRAGHATEALGALNDHQRRFPAGLLTLERRAARAEALCSLGRSAEAQAELSTLSRAAPSSPLTVRAQQRCSARPTEPSR